VFQAAATVLHGGWRVAYPDRLNPGANKNGAPHKIRLTP
jgi:hypothetical protein